jgi:cell division septum initiation protein DivIVA
MAKFNIDASALIDDLAAQIGALQKENLILRHQLKDAETQIDHWEDKKAVKPVRDIKAQ